ncbi:MAG: glycosyltransferase family 4 protein [Bacteroidales bacterium]|jgi:glycosyltransferase involved in cell wall biosynthesis|nr:glycosyltransferase family 4 protein [Bacteroidales bacterium]
MNVLMILDEVFPPDDRVEKEAISLIGAGNSVTLLCLNYGQSKEQEEHKGISVKRLKINRSLRNKIMATYLILPFYKVFWTRAIKKILKSKQIDVIHIHDLPLSDIGIRLRKSHNIRVVCDQHEYYSNWIGNTAHYNTFIGKIVKFLSNWAVYERKNLSQADLVVTVEEPLKEIYISKVGLNPKKMVVLPNTPTTSVFDPLNKDEKIIEEYRNNFVIFYAGHIDILRGINTIIESLPLLRDSIPNLKFVYAGEFTAKYYDPLNYIEKLGVTDLTEYLGWIPLTRIPHYIAASDICIHIPPAISVEVNSTIATKIYQYILMNKPVIVGEAKLMKQFVEGKSIGLSIHDNDPHDLAEKIKLLHSTPSLMAEFAANARKIASGYSWEKTSGPFIEYYQQFNL